MQMLIAQVIANLSLFDPPLPSAPTCTHLQTCWCLHHGNSLPSRLSLTAVDRRRNTGRKIWQHPIRVLQKKGWRFLPGGTEACVFIVGGVNTSAVPTPALSLPRAVLEGLGEQRRGSVMGCE